MPIILYTNEPLHFAKNCYWQELSEGEYELIALTQVDMLRLLSRYDQIRVKNNGTNLSIHAISNDSGFARECKD